MPHPWGEATSVAIFPISPIVFDGKKRGISFTRRAPDCITEELVAVLSSKAAFEFKPLFEILLLNLRERNAASGGEEMLRLRAYEKLQGLVSQGAVNREVTGATKKYKGVATRMVVLRAEMKALRADCNDALSPRLPRLTDCWRPASNSWDAMPTPAVFVSLISLN